MISVRRSRWILATALVWVSAANAQTVLYGNLGASIGGYVGISPTPGPLYNSFSTGSSPILLTDVKLNLDVLYAQSLTATVSVGLYGDNSTSPGTLLTTLGTIRDTSILYNGGVYDFPVSPGFALAANTRYWLGLSSPNGSDSGWAYTGSTSGTGNIAGEYNCSTPVATVTQASGRTPRPAALTAQNLTCVSNGAVSDSYLMQITGSTTATTAVSAPALSTWSMLGLALLLTASSLWMIRSGSRSAT